MKEREDTRFVEDDTTIYEIDLECQKCLMRESQELEQTGDRASDLRNQQQHPY